MAHFAKLGINSKVIGVEVVADDDCKNADGVEDETVGIQFLEHIHGWPLWKQTSYNTHANVHALGGTPFRKNYAGIGFTYDEALDGFIRPKPFDSWILDESKGKYDPPIAYPMTYTQNLGNDPEGEPIPDLYSWDEETTSWTLQTD